MDGGGLSEIVWLSTFSIADTMILSWFHSYRTKLFSLAKFAQAQAQVLCKLFLKFESQGTWGFVCLEAVLYQLLQLELLC